MVSVLRTLQADWNTLVPQATALGIRRVRTLNDPLETIAYRREKLEWLRGEIARLVGTTSLTPAVATDLSALTFGVELELIMPTGTNHNSLASIISRAGIPCSYDGYNHINGTSWKVVTDGSLGDYTRGAEVVSPALRGERGFAQVTKVCEILKAHGCKISKKCGLHVHVGASDFSVDTFKNLFRLYASAEQTIDAFMAPSRRGVQAGNGFCRAIRINDAALTNAFTLDAVAVAVHQAPGRASVRGAGRYCKLNMQSFWQHGTVEFRHHQGTVEADKVVNWVKLCLRMSLAARDGTRAANTFDTLFDAVKAGQDEKQFFAGRAAFFANQVLRSQRAASRVSERRTSSYNMPQAERQMLAEAEAANPFTSTGELLSRRATTR